MPGTCPLADCNYEERPAVNASLFLLNARNLSLDSLIVMFKKMYVIIILMGSGILIKNYNKK